jgi:hypothetical protein
MMPSSVSRSTVSRTSGNQVLIAPWVADTRAWAPLPYRYSFPCVELCNLKIGNAASCRCANVFCDDDNYGNWLRRAVIANMRVADAAGVENRILDR